MERARSESFMRVQLIHNQLVIGLPKCIVREAGIVRRAPYLVRHVGGGLIELRPIDGAFNERLRRARLPG